MTDVLCFTYVSAAVARFTSANQSLFQLADFVASCGIVLQIYG